MAAQTAHTPHLRLERNYTYRTDGYPLGIDDSLNGASSYELDPAGRVTAVESADPASAQRYSYDTGGRLIGAAHEEHGYTGMLLRRAGRSSYDYDGQGRVIRHTRRLLSGGTRVWEYEWDAEDRLTHVRTPDGARWRYTYDPFGRRTAKERLDADGAVLDRTDFAWDGVRLAEQTTSTGTTTWEWQPSGHVPLAQLERGHGEGAGEISRSRAAESDANSQQEVDRQFYAIVTDLVGTPTELLDENGRAAWQTRTGVWGAPVYTSAAGVDCPLRFPGQYFDPETGLHYNLQRYYDPATGRYQSPDPLGLAPAPDPYAYVPNPLTWTDPLGLAPPCNVDPTISEKALNHVLHGDINEEGKFGGWHLYPGDDPAGWPVDRYVKGGTDGMTELADGSIQARGVGALDSEWNQIPKDSIDHTFFPKSWTADDIAKAGKDLFHNGTYSRGSNLVTHTHRGVSMVGFLEKGADGIYRPSTFFPG